MAVEMMEEEASAQRRPLARPIAAMLSGSLVVLALICVILSRKEGATGRYGALLEIRGRRVEKELIRRQDGTAEIEKGLMRQKKAGKQALTALLNLVPLPAVSTVGQGRGGNMRLASSDMSVGVKTSVSIVGNSTLGNLGYIKNTMSTNATNKTADEYAIYRKLFKAEPAYQPAIHLKEQEVDEYTYDVIRCYPSDEKGEVTMVERSASYCWYHPRYCQLLCEPYGASRYLPMGTYDDLGTPTGNAWKMWKDTLKEYEAEA